MTNPVACTLLSFHVTEIRLLDVAAAVTALGVIKPACACVPLHAITNAAPRVIRVLRICIPNLPRVRLVTFCVEIRCELRIEAATLSGGTMQKARRTADASAKPRQFAIVLAPHVQSGSQARSTKRALVRIVEFENRTASHVRGTNEALVTNDESCAKRSGRHPVLRHAHRFPRCAVQKNRPLQMPKPSSSRSPMAAPQAPVRARLVSLTSPARSTNATAVAVFAIATRTQNVSYDDAVTDQCRGVLPGIAMFRFRSRSPRECAVQKERPSQ